MQSPAGSIPVPTPTSVMRQSLIFASTFPYCNTDLERQLREAASRERQAESRLADAESRARALDASLREAELKLATTRAELDAAGRLQAAREQDRARLEEVCGLVCVRGGLVGECK